jgi:hypothetical protein
MIEPLREEHFDDVFRLLTEFVSNTQYSEHLPLEEDFAIGFFDALDDKLSHVAVVDGAVVGMLLAIKRSFWFNSTAQSSMELAWWVSPKCRASTGAGTKLLQAYEDSAKAQGVSYVGLATLDSSGLDRYLTKKGYFKREQAWIKEI